MKKGEKELPFSSIRILSKGLIPVKKIKETWKKTKEFDTTNIKKITNLFKSHANFNLLIDSKDKKFLKGYLTPYKKIGGERDCNKCGKKFQRTSINRAICPKCAAENAQESDHHVSLFSSGHCSAKKGVS